MWNLCGKSQVSLQKVGVWEICDQSRVLEVNIVKKMKIGVCQTTKNGPCLKNRSLLFKIWKKIAAS
jgi:hypothetical protein